MVKNIFSKLFSSNTAPQPTMAPTAVPHQKIYLFESNQYELEKMGHASLGAVQFMTIPFYV